MNIIKYWGLIALLLLMMLLLSLGAAKGQGNSVLSYPKIGHMMPNYMFPDVQYYHSRTASISDFRGKWLILDFWSRNCGACIVEMPDFNKIQKDLGSKVQVLMVGLNSPQIWSADRREHPGRDGNDLIRTLFAKIREQDSLVVPIAWDTVAFARFLGKGVPYTIVVSPSGVVAAVTSGMKTNEMEALMQGNPPPMLPYVLDTENFGKRQYNWDIPYLTNGALSNGGSDTSFMLRDILAKADTGTVYPEGSWFQGGTFTISYEPLVALYKIAFFGVEYWGTSDTLRYGKFSPRIIFRTPDSNELLKGQRYCYSLTLYKNGDTAYYAKGNATDTKHLEEYLQRDLRVKFHYRVSLVDTPLTVYRLVVTDKAKASALKSKGGKTDILITSDKLEMTNIPMSKFAHFILAKTHQHDDFVDNETGITDNIDVSLNGLIDELDQVNRLLNNVGLALVPELKSMKALVISD